MQLSYGSMTWDYGKCSEAMASTLPFTTRKSTLE